MNDLHLSRSKRGIYRRIGILSVYTVLLSAITYLLEYRWPGPGKPEDTLYYLHLGYYLYGVILFDLSYQFYLLYRRVPVVKLNNLHFAVRRYFFGQYRINLSQIEKILIPKEHSEDAMIVVLKKSPFLGNPEKLITEISLPRDIRQAINERGVLCHYVPSIRVRNALPVSNRA